MNNIKTLDLTNIEESEIGYNITRFPDGQQDLKIVVIAISIKDQVIIKSRFNSFRDLEIIIAATKALRRLEVEAIRLYIPYILGARSDRQFQMGGTSYLVDVIAPIINSLNFLTVTCVDPHSDVAAACINNLVIEDNIEVVKWAISDIYENDSNTGNSMSILVSPDAGAEKKIFKVAKEIEHKNIITASKVREIETGKIVRTEVPASIYNDDFYESKDFIIIDDICDGGRTFIEIAKKIKEMRSDCNIYLIVTHGIFSAGLKELSEYFACIYTTNSIMDVNSSTEFGMRNEKYLHKLKQLNVF